MKKIEIKSQEYKLENIGEDFILYTKDLNDEIACSFFSGKLKKVCLARNIGNKELLQIIGELNPERLIEPGLIRVQIVGGEANSEKSIKYLEQLIEQLMKIDNNQNIINIISCDTNHKLHNNSIEIDGYHGGIRIYNSN